MLDIWNAKLYIFFKFVVILTILKTQSGKSCLKVKVQISNCFKIFSARYIILVQPNFFDFRGEFILKLSVRGNRFRFSKPEVFVFLLIVSVTNVEESSILRFLLTRNELEELGKL